MSGLVNNNFAVDYSAAASQLLQHKLPRLILHRPDGMAAEFRRILMQSISFDIDQ